MIILENEHLIASGNERHCFQHPLYKDVCIKINRKKSYIDDTPEQSLVEYDYYKELARKKIILTHLPKCFGWIDTNLGKGLSYQKIIDEREGKTITLEKAINQNKIKTSEAKAILKELYEYLTHNKILISDLNMANISIRTQPVPKAFLVDGLGSRNFDLKYKLRKKIGLLAFIKTKKQWKNDYPKELINPKIVE